MRLTRPLLVLMLVAGVCAFSVTAGRAQQTEPSPAAAETNPPIPSPKPGVDDPKVHKMAVQQFLAWQSGAVDRDLYSEAVNAELTDEVMTRATKTLANMGALQSVAYRGIAAAKGVNLFVYRMTCEHGSVDMDFTVEPTGKIGLIFFE